MRTAHTTHALLILSMRLLWHSCQPSRSVSLFAHIQSVRSPVPPALKKKIKAVEAEFARAEAALEQQRADDRTSAAKWYRKAAAQGVVLAQFNLKVRLGTTPWSLISALWWTA